MGILVSLLIFLSLIKVKILNDNFQENSCFIKAMIYKLHLNFMGLSFFIHTNIHLCLVISNFLYIEKNDKT